MDRASNPQIDGPATPAGTKPFNPNESMSMSKVRRGVAATIATEYEERLAWEQHLRKALEVGRCPICGSRKGLKVEELGSDPTCTVKSWTCSRCKFELPEKRKG